LRENILNRNLLRLEEDSKAKDLQRGVVGHNNVAKAPWAPARPTATLPMPKFV
jgi:hypothetical protein